MGDGFVIEMFFVYNPQLEHEERGDTPIIQVEGLELDSEGQGNSTINDTDLRVYNRDCCICLEILEPGQPVTRIRCGHRLHSQCTRGLGQEAMCPYW